MTERADQDDGSQTDARSHADRIAAGDSPAGSIAFESEVGGRIDVPGWVDVKAIERSLKSYAASKDLAYHPSDRDDVLRAIGRDVPPGEGAQTWQAEQLALAMIAARTKYDERAAS